MQSKITSESSDEKCQKNIPFFVQKKKAQGVTEWEDIINANAEMSFLKQKKKNK